MRSNRKRVGLAAGSLPFGFRRQWMSMPRWEEMVQPSYDLPLPDQIDAEDALPPAMGQIAILLELERLGALSVVRSAADIRNCMSQGRMAAIFHIEGAEAIDADLHSLDVFHAAGLRSLGPVWSRPNIFGHGVPFTYPSGPDTGPGLTDHGLRLVQPLQCAWYHAGFVPPQ